MGLFDLPAPILTWLDHQLSGFLPAWCWMVILALVSSVLSMGLYAWISPQQKLKQFQQEAQKARSELSKYDGEFDGLPPLVKRVLGLSLKHLGMILLPAMAASLPLICILVWLSNHYGPEVPVGGETVCVQTHPADIETLKVFPERTAGGEGKRCLAWPADAKITLQDEKRQLSWSLDMALPVGRVHKKSWWNYLIANPAGYLPDDLPLEWITFDFKDRQIIALGPDWMRGWEASFLISLLIFSIAIKIIFKIE
ncbi:MAG: hypothetical protein GWM98_22175 [Nitrospinaceae bacterium]|nr:hypothetical protein [Nitrospinaceae bacterium]NIR56665.1 hypothetical protein [Nitrospinaceae bacterium]NIS87128.1 hypothetical protein [Nitrospinaceae bacterium]NIT83982.1 hypothetical protein [Nitrospinaceae bacterium]NIU46172.1 hypothetical protein [Nitrospinaceae bacterium]